MMSKDIAILGGGISGAGAAMLAKKNGLNVFVSDNSCIDNMYKELFIQNNIEFEEKKHTSSIILSAKEIIKSPGIPDDIPIIKEILNKGILIISEIEFAYRYTNAKIAAVTGTNGKTTTCLLLGHILKSAGYDVKVLGNIGAGFAFSLLHRDYEYIILELSSFQLDYIKDFRSKVSILLNITPDHLDRYNHNIEEYFSSKCKITANQISEDFFIYNADQACMQEISTKAKKIPISIIKELEIGAYFKNNTITLNLNNKIMTIQELALQGKHNAFNSMAAAIAARVFEVKDSIIRQSMIDFQNVEHRLEYVITVHGIEFINDSKATNVNASWFALESMNKNIVWIAGGVDKGNNYSELLPIVKDKVRSIVCLGNNNENIVNSFKSDVDAIVEASSMKEAVSHAYNLALKGDIVLLSPACASFDLFQNYEDRGLQFKKEVRKL